MITNFSSYALKVEDLDDAVAFYVKHFEARPCASGGVFGCNYASVNVADTMVYFFDKALYENAIGRVLPYGYLHAVFEVDDFEHHVEAMTCAGVSLVMEPQLVEASFGTRKIAFFETPGGVRTEIMKIVSDG